MHILLRFLAFVFFFFFFFASIAVFGRTTTFQQQQSFSNTSTNNNGGKTTTLRLVQAVWRHGDRAPVRKPFPGDLHGFLFARNDKISSTNQ
jgi:hypothetical protein